MKTFYHLLANTVLASITNFTVWFAITFFVYLETKSVFATSMISGFYLVTTAASGIWFGSLVDRYRKKQMMLVSSLVSLILYALGFLLYSTAPAEAFTVVGSGWLWIFVPLLLLGVIAGNIRNVALPTLITILVEEKRRDRANGLAGTATGIGFMVTSVISGLLVGHSGMYLVLLLAMLVTTLALVHLWFVPVDEVAPSESESAVHHHLPDKHSAPAPVAGAHSTIDLKGTIAAISAVPGLLALIFFTTFNNFLGGVFMALMDAYGLSLVSVQVWGLMWGFLSTAFIAGGLIIAKFGLGNKPLRTMFLANIVIWIISSSFTVYPSIYLLVGGMFIYLAVVPFIEAAEHTIIQKVVPPKRQGRVFGFAQSVEQAASPLTAFAIGPIAEFIFIPFMTTGAGVDLIGSWWGTGSDRGIALVFTLTGIIGLTMTLMAMRTRYYRLLATQYQRA